MNSGPCLGPGGVLRAAAWPLELLDGFGDPELADADPAGPGFATACEVVLARERQALWARFRAEPRLQQAIALASRSAYARLRSAAERPTAPRNRAMRLAEYTLYRYLARAAGRATPHGLWAGVANLRFGPRTRVLVSPPAARFSPALQPFQSLLGELGRQPRQRAALAWRLNPTLYRDPARDWRFLHRADDGSVSERKLAAEPALDAILGHLRQHPGLALETWAVDIAGAGLAALGVRRGLRKLLDDLADAGLLVGGLGLPASYATAWEALAAAAQGLDAAQSKAWSECLEGLGEDCGHAAEAVAAASVPKLLQVLDAAAEHGRVLAARLGCAPPGHDGPILRCDWRLPWRLELGPDLVSGVRRAVREYQAAWQDRVSPAAAWRAISRQRLAELLGSGKSLGEATRLLATAIEPAPATWPAPGEGDRPLLDRRLRRWRDHLYGRAGERLAAAEPQAGAYPPMGCAFVGLAEEPTLCLRSLSDIPAIATQRFAGLLELTALTDWIGQGLRAHGLARGLRVARLDAPFEDNPDVLAGPTLLTERVAPWHCVAGIDLDRARVGCTPDGAGPYLLPADGGPPVAVMATGAANQQARDPLAQLLLWTGWHESPGRGSRAVEVPLADEADRAEGTRAIRLPGGSLLRSRRWLLRATLADLTRRRGLDRFRCWQSLARALGWPAQLQISFDGAPPLRLHRDSPLGVEAAFKGVGRSGACAAVEAAEPARGFEIPGVGHCVVELCLPFANRPATDERL